MVMQKSTCTHRSLSPHEQRCGLPIATLNLLDARAGLRRRGGAAADEAEAKGGWEEEEEVVEVEVEVEEEEEEEGEVEEGEVEEGEGGDLHNTSDPDICVVWD